MTGIDWTDAFDNSGYVKGSDKLGDLWSVAASAFRGRMIVEGRAQIDIAYGPGLRQKMDLFRADGKSRGLIIFVHGGYWQMFDKSYWSHLAQGPLAQGWDVAIPSYKLAPEARVSDITREITTALTQAASMTDGPLRLIGHSAGGHLVSRMVCDDCLLPDAVRMRVQKVISLSGVHDLRPLVMADMNEILNLTEQEAIAESPALRDPLPDVPVVFWVGAGERPEFLRQTRLICEKWEQASKHITAYYEPDRNHFTVVEKLADPDSPLVTELTGGEE